MAEEKEIDLLKLKNRKRVNQFSFQWKYLFIFLFALSVVAWRLISGDFLLLSPLVRADKKIDTMSKHSSQFTPARERIAPKESDVLKAQIRYSGTNTCIFRFFNTSDKSITCNITYVGKVGIVVGDENEKVKGFVTIPANGSVTIDGIKGRDYYRRIFTAPGILKIEIEGMDETHLYELVPLVCL